MDAKVANAIHEASLGSEAEVEIYQNYSGRGMFEERTTAVTCDRFSHFAAAVAAAAGGLDPCEDSEMIEEIVLACSLLRQDAMGLGIVLY